MDDTQDVVSNYPAPIIYHRHSKNCGNAQSRNTAFSLSSGHFIAFMDDDDEWIDIDKLKKQYLFLSQNPSYSLSCTSVLLVSSKSSCPKLIYSPLNLKRHILMRNGLIYSPTVLVTRDLLIKSSGFDPKVLKGVDSDFYRYHILYSAINIHFLEDLTTAIYECIDRPRMTKVQSFAGLCSSLQSQIYTIVKYRSFFVSDPFALAYRILQLFKLPHLFVHISQNFVNPSFLSL